MYFQRLRQIVCNYTHRDSELFIKELFTIIVNSQFVIDIPLVKEVAVFNVWAVVFFKEVWTVFCGAIWNF